MRIYDIDHLEGDYNNVLRGFVNSYIVIVYQPYLNLNKPARIVVSSREEAIGSKYRISIFKVSVWPYNFPKEKYEITI